MMQRCFLPGNPTVTKMHDGNVRKPQRRHERFQMVMTVNDIRWSAQPSQIVDDRNGGATEVIRDRSEDEAESHGMMPAAQQRQRDIAHIGLGSAALAQPVIGEENRELAHTPRAAAMTSAR